VKFIVCHQLEHVDQLIAVAVELIAWIDLSNEFAKRERRIVSGQLRQIR